MEALILILTLLILLDIAAARWGVDSRDGFSHAGAHRR
jgi:hypothetical protein